MARSGNTFGPKATRMVAHRSGIIMSLFTYRAWMNFGSGAAAILRLCPARSEAVGLAFGRKNGSLHRKQIPEHLIKSFRAERCFFQPCPPLGRARPTQEFFLVARPREMRPIGSGSSSRILQARSLTAL